MNVLTEVDMLSLVAGDRFAFTDSQGFIIIAATPFRVSQQHNNPPYYKVDPPFGDLGTLPPGIMVGQEQTTERLRKTIFITRDVSSPKQLGVLIDELTYIFNQTSDPRWWQK